MFHDCAARLTVLYFACFSAGSTVSICCASLEYFCEGAAATACCAVLRYPTVIPHFCLVCILVWGHVRLVSLSATMLQGSMLVIQEGNTLEATSVLVWDMCVWYLSDPSSTFWRVGRPAGASIMPPWLRCAWPLSASLTPPLLAGSSTDLPRSVCCLLHKLSSVYSQNLKMVVVSAVVSMEALLLYLSL